MTSSFAGARPSGGSMMNIPYRPLWMWRGSGVELVDVAGTRIHDLEHAVHVGRVDAVEVDRVGVRPGVRGRDAKPVPFLAADGRSRHLPVERPRVEVDTGRDLDLLVDGDDAVLAQRLTAGQRGLEPPVERVDEEARV